MTPYFNSISASPLISKFAITIASIFLMVSIYSSCIISISFVEIYKFKSKLDDRAAEEEERKRILGKLNSSDL
jgi:hypothetical protein